MTAGRVVPASFGAVPSCGCAEYLALVVSRYEVCTSLSGIHARRVGLSPNAPPRPDPLTHFQARIRHLKGFMRSPVHPLLVDGEDGSSRSPRLSKIADGAKILLSEEWI